MKKLKGTIEIEAVTGAGFVPYLIVEGEAEIRLRPPRDTWGEADKGIRALAKALGISVSRAKKRKSGK